ncbi:4Fe-4S binding protein [Phytobacter sp. V91]|uniref:4Fe-4S binding protein n=1 Tax=Phytobacter sp. V91 TaxID=3369425 RepID=UPI003F5E4A45
MASHKRDAGREARQCKGVWRSYPWLLLRRLCQFTVLGLFLSGPYAGVWVLRGNYSGSLLLDSVPLTDPLMALQSLVSGHLPATLALTGALIVILGYALAGKRLFCGWVCPLNPVTDAAAWLRRRLGLTASASLPRHLRYLLLALFLFDLLVVEHGWCGHLCPTGALYAVTGQQSVLRVTAPARAKCTRCMDCFHVCPEPQVLRAPVLDDRSPAWVTAKECMTCGRCVDVCPQEVFKITIRWNRGAKP